MDEPTPPPATFTAFFEGRRVAAGPLATVVVALHARRDALPQGALLLFRDQDGRAVDLRLDGPLDDALARAEAELSPRPSRGRPRLGVVSREISLLPRHWEWLEEQPQGLSGTLRRLVEEAMKREPERQRARRAMEATARVLTALAGDRPGFEEALRALYQGDRAAFHGALRPWPADVRSYGKRLAEDAFLAPA